MYGNDVGSAFILSHWGNILIVIRMTSDPLDLLAENLIIQPSVMALRLW